MNETINEKSWTQYFRIITPIFIVTLNLLAGIIISNQETIKRTVGSIDSKLFLHLTNDAIHSPKGFVVTTAEFKIYQEFRTKEVGALRDDLVDLNHNMKEQLRITLANGAKLDAMSNILHKK